MRESQILMKRIDIKIKMRNENNFKKSERHINLNPSEATASRSYHNVLISKKTKMKEILKL